jgi:hypothetical protein
LQVVLCDAIALTAPAPYLPLMCKDRFELPDAEVGLAVGALAGTFSLANSASSFYIGSNVRPSHAR